MENKLEIPQEYKNLCIAIAKLLNEFNIKNGYFSPISDTHAVYSFNGHLRINNPNASNIQINWQCGRHG